MGNPSQANRARPLTIAKAAAASGIGIETIRYYERRGLIRQPLRPVSGGSRDYGGETLRRLRFIASAKRLGFSLSEIAELLALRAEPDAGCDDIRARARAKRADVQGRIDQLMRIRDALDELIAECPGRGSVGACSIIGAIESGEAG